MSWWFQPLKPSAAAAGTDANAGLASGTGAASAASVNVQPNAGHASGTGEAFAAAALVAGGPPVAAGTGGANQPSVAIAVNAGQATGTGAAFDATVTTSTGTDAAAEVATGTGAAFNTSTAVAASAGNAAGTGTAQQPGAGISPNAELASGSGAAFGLSLLVPIWTTPLDGVSMPAAPELKFTMPNLAADQHFHLQIDTAATFDTVNLVEANSEDNQTGWDFWNGTGWEAVPVTGVPTTYVGNEARYTVQSPLAGGTWYRRVRAGV